MRASQYEGIARRKIIPFRRATSTFEPRFHPEYAPIAMPAMMERIVAGRRIMRVQTDFSQITSRAGRP